MLTMQEIKSSDRDILYPKDVAEVLGVMPYSINCQAKDDISKLGFPCSLIGTRVRIPRIGFIRWVEGSADNV